MRGRWSGKGGLLWFEDSDEEGGIWVAGVGDGEEGLKVTSAGSLVSGAIYEISGLEAMCVI